VTDETLMRAVRDGDVATAAENLVQDVFVRVL
jgi:hypothetical protein